MLYFVCDVLFLHSNIIYTAGTTIHMFEHTISCVPVYECSLFNVFYTICDFDKFISNHDQVWIIALYVCIGIQIIQDYCLQPSLG
jgi:hypothetical protein